MIEFIKRHQVLNVQTLEVQRLADSLGQFLKCMANSASALWIIGMKRKPHNQNKRLITQSIIAMRNLALTMKLSELDKGVDVINYKTSKPEPVGQSIAQALDRTAFKWAILLVVNAVERNGKTKTLTNWTRLAAPYKHSALTEWLRKEHGDMIDDCKGKCEVIDAGWVAVPTPPAFADDLTEQILIDNLLELIA